MRRAAAVPLPLRRWYNSRLSVVFESVLIGFMTGLLVVSFRAALSLADEHRAALYTALAALPARWLLLWTLALILTGLLLGFLAAKWPMLRGSGIPQVKGALHREMVLDWLPELPLKLITGVLGLGAGLSLGREGPSIQIGAYVGKGVLTALRRPHRERKILITSASAAGLAAAFNAPLAGVLFVLEELQAGFSPLFIACAMGASMAADVVASYFFGLAPVFDFSYIPALPLRAYPAIVLLGALCGLLGDCFKRALYAAQDFYDRLRVPPVLRPVLPLLLSIPLGFYLSGVTGGGHELIENLAAARESVGWIAAVFAVKLLFTAVCYGSGAPGGIFLPLLACGALAGGGLGTALAGAGLLTEAQVLNMVILGMAGYFAGVVKAPVCGIVLILEMSGNFNHLASLVLVCLSSFITAELINSRPVYTTLLERMLNHKTPDSRRGIQAFTGARQAGFRP
jgi:H+/Cl- antiporter ClcA